MMSLTTSMASVWHRAPLIIKLKFGIKTIKLANGYAVLNGKHTSLLFGKLIGRIQSMVSLLLVVLLIEQSLSGKTGVEEP